MLGVCQFLGVLGRLGYGLMQLRSCLTFKMPSPITLSIPDSADLKQNLACLPSMWQRTLTSAWRLCAGVALYAPETVLGQWFPAFRSLYLTPFRKYGVVGGRAHHAGQPVVMAGRTTAVEFFWHVIPVTVIAILIKIHYTMQIFVLLAC